MNQSCRIDQPATVVLTVAFVLASPGRAGSELAAGRIRQATLSYDAGTLLRQLGSAL